MGTGLGLLMAVGAAVIKVASVSELRAIEAAADRSLMPYAQMMLNAGRDASACLQRRVNIGPETRILFLIGTGNNGGDGLVMAQDLAERTAAEIRVYLLKARDFSSVPLQGAARIELPTTAYHDDRDLSRLTQWAREADVIVDALFGIGARLPLGGDAVAILDCVSECLAAMTAAAPDKVVCPARPERGQRGRRPMVFAIDCPSGVDCDSGKADPSALAADVTMTFIAAKPGLFVFPAAAFVGELVISRIGFPTDWPALQQLPAQVVDGVQAAALLPQRPLDGHKGTFGKVMLAVGGANYIGAAALAGESACRSGAGLVTVAATNQVFSIVAGQLREPTWLPLADIHGAIAEAASDALAEAAQAYQALLVGCGLGLHESTRAFVWRLLEAASLPPLVIDADALNALASRPGWPQSLPRDTIITPHSGEMARLTGLASTEIQSDRWRVARRFAEAWGVVVVLKGAHTIIAAPDGRASVIPFKSDALATAGTGDVLSGLIAGLRAQGAAAYESACLGAYVHALAGLIAAERVKSSRSVIAGDLLDALGAAFERLERG